MRRIIAGLILTVTLIVGLIWLQSRSDRGEPHPVPPPPQPAPSSPPAPLPGLKDEPAAEAKTDTGTVAGIVATADRRPWPGAFEIRLLSTRSPNLPVVASRSIPAGDGSFQVEGVPPGWYLVQAVAGALGGASAGVRVDPRQPVHDLWIVIRPVGSVSGVVLRADTGEPIEGAKIESAERVATATEPIRIAVTTSDPEGRFRLPGLPPGMASLSVTAKGFAPGQVNDVEIVAGRETSGTVIRLGVGGTIRGTVYGLDGAPTPGARVVLVPVIEGKRFIGNFGPDAAGDETGTYRFLNVPPGRYQVRRFTNDSTPVIVMDDVEDEPDEGEPVLEVGEGEVVVFDVRSDTTGTIRGTVRSKGGKPLRRQVSVLGTDGKPLADEGPPRMVLPDEQGVFELQNLLPGEYLLETNDVHTPVTVRAGQITPVEIVLEVGSLGGIVLDETGAPVAGAKVRTNRRTNSKSSPLRPRVEVVPVVQTGADGRFSFEGLTAGNYRLAARKGAASAETETFELRPGETANDIEIRFSGTVEVRVLVRNAEGAALEGIPVQLDAQRTLTNADGVAVFQASPGQHAIIAGTLPDALMQVVQITPAGGQEFTLTLR